MGQQCTRRVLKTAGKCKVKAGPYERILVILGTRPEAIKLAPVVRELRRQSAFEVKVCVTGQHRQMLDQVLELFNLAPDFDLNLMTANQHLNDLTAAIIHGMNDIFRRWRPDLALVQGDTTTTLGAGLASFYEKIPVGHIEAGLRTGNRSSPWPEEINRRLTTIVCTHHFAPTEGARRNLLRENVDPGSVLVTGNTVIDALKEVLARIAQDKSLNAICEKEFSFLDVRRRLVLVTGHRRENFGEAFRRICMALRELSMRDDAELVYPVHLNPNVRGPVHQMLAGVKNIHLLGPLEYMRFSYLLNRAHLIITDSGGIQEEGTYLGKPVLVMRDTTERPEALEAGTAKLVGTHPMKIVAEAHNLLNDELSYRKMARPSNHFGDGFASERIGSYLKSLKGVAIAGI
jgi:UDP-N-acetylglucosamine 2-epimerase (non-hydrolysing)